MKYLRFLFIWHRHAWMCSRHRIFVTSPYPYFGGAGIVGDGCGVCSTDAALAAGFMPA
jgi:hypothetical protein